MIPSGSFRQESGARLYVLFQSFLSLYEYGQNYYNILKMLHRLFWLKKYQYF
ncbi:hypothetical protein NTGZN8_140006 [Candidatus Nitrotoga fabula]|uniref:Uncharacterized protein n=1 Tax=Candidatus Nitrotoga fabula TaxID=2182327 RepID=A0A916BDR5_9PROT|nr:hypothetical protein NTGZN8_140006 [Candidatus Nitrotoga fabula]